MARIPEEEIERLKREISIERLAETRGIRLAVHGADRVGLCPFHDDRESSLVISPAKNLWHCLGACQSGGSVIDWVMRAEGVSFRHAGVAVRGEERPAGYWRALCWVAALCEAPRCRSRGRSEARVPSRELPS